MPTPGESDVGAALGVDGDVGDVGASLGAGDIAVGLALALAFAGGGEAYAPPRAGATFILAQGFFIVFILSLSSSLPSSVLPPPKSFMVRHGSSTIPTTGSPFVPFVVVGVRNDNLLFMITMAYSPPAPAHCRRTRVHSTHREVSPRPRQAFPAETLSTARPAGTATRT